MLDRVLRFFITIFLAFAGIALLNLARPVLTLFLSTEILKADLGFFQVTAAGLVCVLVGGLLGGIIGFVLSPYLIRQLKRFSLWLESALSEVPIHDVIAGAVGLCIGLILANLLAFSFSKIPVVGDYIPVVFSLVFGYLGIRIALKKRQEITDYFDFVPKALKELSRIREQRMQRAAEKDTAASVAAGTLAESGTDKQYKLLDTSVIIDGRIADICDTGFIEGTLLIPVFVLEELQHIADSPDSLKRTRGRRGLDILQKIRQEKKLKVEVTNVDFDDIREVDSKLVALGQKVHGKIITNDFNLNKVAKLRGVEVLNINELANAVKPVVIPGETMKIHIVKEGKEPGQGVAYLDDGTMIVVESGSRLIGKTIDATVTSALQTAAGRMIFARPISA